MALDRGPWIQTFTGRQFFPLDPRPEDIDIEDIAHSLANKCRYAGHCLRFYSVAEHSWLLSYHVEPHLARAALLHDAHEAYSPFGDVPRPLKEIMPMVRDMERVLDLAIERAFHVSLHEPEIKLADTRILLDERAQNMEKPPAPWNINVLPLGVTLSCWSPEIARRRFLKRWQELAQ